MAPVVVVIPPSRALSQEGNLLVTGIDMFAFLIPENVSKWKAVVQASASVTYVHHFPNPNDGNEKLPPFRRPAASLIFILLGKGSTHLTAAPSALSLKKKKKNS